MKSKKKQADDIDRDLSVSYRKRGKHIPQNQCINCHTRILLSSSYEFVEGFYVCNECFEGLGDEIQ